MRGIAAHYPASPRQHDPASPEQITRVFPAAVTPFLEEVAAVGMGPIPSDKLRPDIFAASPASTHGTESSEASAKSNRSRRAWIILKLVKGVSWCDSRRPRRVGGVKPGAAHDDVLSHLHQLVAPLCHRQWQLRKLTYGIEGSELAFGRGASEANYAWFAMSQARLSRLMAPGPLSGFGESSGRFQRSHVIK